jgi:hypothetical protein
VKCVLLLPPAWQHSRNMGAPPRKGHPAREGVHKRQNRVVAHRRRWWWGMPRTHVRRFGRFGRWVDIALAPRLRSLEAPGRLRTCAANSPDRPTGGLAWSVPFCRAAGLIGGCLQEYYHMGICSSRGMLMLTLVDHAGTKSADWRRSTSRSQNSMSSMRERSPTFASTVGRQAGRPHSDHLRTVVYGHRRSGGIHGGLVRNVYCLCIAALLSSLLVCLSSVVCLSSTCVCLLAGYKYA